MNTQEALEYLLPIYESTHSAQYKEALGMAMTALAMSPREIGRWRKGGCCSVCGVYDLRDPYGSTYCHNCGALMVNGMKILNKKGD